MRSIFSRRKSETDIMSTQLRGTEKAPGRKPSSDFTAPVNYLGHVQIADSKSVPSMFGAIAQLKRRKGNRQRVTLSIRRDRMIVGHGDGVLFQAPFGSISMCLQDCYRRFGSRVGDKLSDHFAITITISGELQLLHNCHVFQARSTEEVRRGQCFFFRLFLGCLFVSLQPCFILYGLTPATRHHSFCKFQ